MSDAIPFNGTLNFVTLRAATSRPYSGCGSNHQIPICQCASLKPTAKYELVRNHPPFRKIRRKLRSIFPFNFPKTHFLKKCLHILCEYANISPICQMLRSGCLVLVCVFRESGRVESACVQCRAFSQELPPEHCQ